MVIINKKYWQLQIFVGKIWEAKKKKEIWEARYFHSLQYLPQHSY